MRARFALALAAPAVFSASALGGGGVLWDNYPGDLIQPAHALTSERNTAFVESTWSTDDVDLSGEAELPSDILITGIQWVGLRDPGFTYSKADVIFLDGSLNDATSVTYSNLTASQTPYVPDPNSDPLREVYTGSIDFAVPISPVATYFYVGIRLVGDGAFKGRNLFVTHTIDTSNLGLTGGYVKSAVIGAPFWRPASDVWYGTSGDARNFEFAFRLYGSIVPEPASLGLLALGGLLVFRRR